jgi:hypothetical protein
MEKKYSISMSNTGNDSYSLVINSYNLDAEGQRINEHTEVYTDKTLDECKTLIAAI